MHYGFDNYCVRSAIWSYIVIGPPIPVSRCTEYRDTATNLSGINTGIEVTEYRHGRYWCWAHRQCGQCPSASFRTSMNAWSMVTQSLVTILLSWRLLLPVPASLSLSVSQSLARSRCGLQLQYQWLKSDSATLLPPMFIVCTEGNAKKCRVPGGRNLQLVLPQHTTTK